MGHLGLTGEVGKHKSHLMWGIWADVAGNSITMPGGCLNQGWLKAGVILLPGLGSLFLWTLWGFEAKRMEAQGDRSHVRATSVIRARRGSVLPP